MRRLELGQTLLILRCEREARASKDAHSLHRSSHPPHIKRRLLPGAVAAKGAFRPDGVRALEDPVLPRGEAGEDLRLHRLRPAETEVRLHAGERIRREARALFEEYADLVFPIDVVEGEGDEPERFGLLRLERAADGGLRG